MKFFTSFVDAFREGDVEDIVTKKHTDLRLFKLKVLVQNQTAREYCTKCKIALGYTAIYGPPFFSM